MNIPFTLGNVAEIAVAPIDASATVNAGGAGNRMVFAAVVVSPKGRPFEVLQINDANWMTVLGQPFHASKGAVAESLRHISEAVKGGAGCVVRAIPDSYRYPAITLNLFDVVPDAEVGIEQEDPATLPVTPAKKSRKSKQESQYLAGKAGVNLSIQTSALAHGSEVVLTVDAALAIWVNDGSESTNRSVQLTPADVEQYGSNMFELLLTEADLTGNDVELERMIVSMDENSVDDMGRSAFIETVLENRSKYLLAKVGAKVSQMTSMAKTAFVGGTAGDLSLIQNQDLTKAISVLKNTVIGYTAVISAGIYDEAAIRSLADLCDSRRIGGFVDIDPRKNYAEALEMAGSLALNRERISLYHFPYTYKDGFYGSRTMCGLSGVAFVAKAKGVAKSFPVGGWHYTGAGEERAIIPRSGLRVVEGIGEPDFEAMYKARINKVAANAAGLMFIDDSLTTYTRENYLRFEQVVSVADAISRDFYNLANTLKHNPDGITFDGLVNGMTDILDGYVANGALVRPRDPEDGKEPYRLIVEQTDIDAWKCRWAICVTGSGRRFMGEPVLVR